MPTLCESLIRHISQEGKIGGWWMGNEGNQFHWSDSVYALFGIQKNGFKLTLDNALTMFAMRDQERIRDAIGTALSTQKPLDIEVSVLYQNAKKHLRIRGQHVRSIPGISLMGSVQDVSELKNLALEAEHNHSKYKNVVESAMDAIISIDGAQKIVLFNREAERMFGWEADEILGQSLDVLMPQRMRDAHARHVEGYLQDGAHSYRAMGRNRELWGLRKDGGEFAIEASLSKFRTEGDTISTVIVRDVSVKKAYEKKIYSLAYTDQLTGLGNRNALYEDFSDIQASATSLELALIDLDRFKDINDSLGHRIGDEVLAQMGAVLHETAAPCHHHAYRLAGDVFVLVARGKIMDSACGHLLALGSAPTLIDNNALWPGVSIGISRAPQDGDTLEKLIKCADAALLQAKQKGGRRLEHFNANLLSYIEAKTLLQSRLEDSLAKHELSYSFQPIVDLQDGAIIGYEALARWQHDGHSISPEIFIALAEESGHIHRIQEYLFEYLAECLDVVGDTAFLALNISPSQLASDRLYDTLLGFFANTGFPPARIELELTERSLLLVGEEVMNRLERLKDLGCKLSIDDFGTGYSCLSYLKELPIDKMKIDQSFVINIGNDPKNLAVVATIIDLAKRLGMSVVAEGIEKTSQADILQKMGCRQGQGYLFSKPLTVVELRK